MPKLNLAKLYNNGPAQTGKTDAKLEKAQTNMP